jgi:hypothetical protein
MGKNRIKYYSPADFATRYNIELANTLLKAFDYTSPPGNINDAIELFSILKYINAGILGNWEVGIESKIKKSIGLFLSLIKTKSLEDLYCSVEADYYSEFWEFFSCYNIYKKYDSTSYSEFLENERPYINYILQNEKLVQYYDICLRNYFKTDYNNATIILDIYEADVFHNAKYMYLPISLTEDEKEDLIKKYVECDTPNINYLELIITIINRKGLRISSKTKLLATRRLKKEREILFEKSEIFTTGVSIAYSKDKDVETTCTHKDGITHLVYSYNWIRENLDFSTLLNNFIYLFEFSDQQMRITLTSKESEIGTMEKVFGVKGKKNYHDSMTFHHKEQISDIQLSTYIALLKSFDINFEDVLSWFFSVYLRENFKIDNFQIFLPSTGTTYFEKCRTIVPEIEGVLKKFNLLVEDGHIDTELLEISNNVLSFSNYKSFFNKKYIYPKSNEFNQACYFFFSDQCMLSYFENDKKSYKSFFDLIRQQKIHRSDYRDYMQSQIDWLIDRQFLAENSNLELVIDDPLLVRIIYELYYNETINYLNIPVILQRKIDELINADYLSFEGSLFSQNEQHYLNYYLNRSEYGNSLNLRNRYVHGTQPQADKNNDIYSYHYLIFMKLLVLIIIKINDEFCNKNV